MRTPAAVVLTLALAGCSGEDAKPVPSSGQLPRVVSYCGGTFRGFELPSDPAARGPWQVGAKTVSVAGLRAEVWYPARPGSTTSKYTYDLREYLPEAQQQTVTESTTIHQPCDCYREPPLDAERAPFPVILFLHGFSGIRTQSLEHMTHWASRGFVVVAADHPSLGLKTFLSEGLAGLDIGLLGASPACGSSPVITQLQEARSLLDALQSPSGDLAFLAGAIDMKRLGVAGHSAGAMGTRLLSDYPDVKVAAPLSGDGVCDSASLESALVMGGMADAIVAYSRQRGGYGATPAAKRLVGLANAGHMAFTSFCPIGSNDGGILNAAKKAGVVFDPAFEAIVAPLASDGCQPDKLPAERGWEVINFATAGAFEETLLCLPERAAELSKVRERFGDAVGEYQEQLD
jgi:dienelactone hydrolase